MRRLIQVEFDRTVQGIFGVQGSPASGWPSSGAGTGFSSDVSGQSPTADGVEQTMLSAELVAKDVVTRLGALLPCAAQVSLQPQVCGTAFIEKYGRRLFRRPLTATDRARLGAIFTWALSRGTFPDAIRLVTVSMLQSPHFLYRPEVGTQTDNVGEKIALKLSAHELATRLSYALTSSAPDEALLDAADQDALSTSEQLAAQARRLLQSDAGKKTVKDFFTQWLKLERLDAVTRDASVIATFTPALGSAMNQGTYAFLEDVAFGAGPGNLQQLYGSNQVYVNALTAPLYGLSGVTGTALQKRTVSANPRAGLLTDMGLLTQLASPFQTSPVGRGKFIYETLLCQYVPPPPGDLMIELPPPDPTLTTRERFAQHRSNPACSGCHAFFDPPGFALENYDAVGKYRTIENGKAVDASGSVTLDAKTYVFDGATGLSALMSGSAQPRRCFEQRWFAFVFGRDHAPSDGYSLYELTTLPNEAALRDVMLTLVQTPSFRHRPLVPATECVP